MIKQINLLHNIKLFLNSLQSDLLLKPFLNFLEVNNLLKNNLIIKVDENLQK